MTLVPSLSIVLPVYNAQATLGEQLCRLLEMLPDLTERFEIIVVDDGSSDQTAEIAAELGPQFPQLRFIRHGRRQGQAAAIETGMATASSDFVVVHEAQHPLSGAELRRLWSMRNEEDLVVARALPQARPVDANLVARLMNWGRNVEYATAGSPPAGTQMVRRSAMKQVASQTDPALRMSQERGSEKITRIIPRRHGAGIVNNLRDFALGE